MKKLLITILAVLMVATGVIFVAACGSNEVLKNYTLSQDGGLVEEDFDLPLTIGDKAVTWTANNDAITIEKGDTSYIAKVNLGDEAQAVELTVNCGKESKKFTVTVAAMDVYYFSSKYSFPQNLSTVFEDFDLDTSYTINGKTATIEWSVEREQDQDYIAISADGKSCIVTESSIDTIVRINAKFTYNNVSTSVPYRMTVSFKREHLEEVDYWYNNTGVSITMSGYVVLVGTAYDSGYKNVSLYIVDDDFCAGYYLYRVVTDDENGNKLDTGVHVTVTGTINTNYNGLIETNAGGKLVVDDDIPALSEKELADTVYALDNDLLSGAPSTIYNESRLVSLDKWEVSEMYKSAPVAGSTSTLFTLKKGDVKVLVVISKYLEGAYLTNEKDDTWNALVDLYSTVKVGDIVSVTGILGKTNSGYQIMPLSAEDVKVADAGVEASAIPEFCGNVTKAIADVQKVFTDNAGYLIVADKEFEVPATSNNVDVTYKLLRDSDTVTLEDGKIIVKVGKEDIATVQATFTVGEDYETVVFFSIHSLEMSDDQVASRVAFELEIVKQTTGGFELPVSVTEYPGAEISWALETEVEGVTVAENKINIEISETQRTAVLVATVSCRTAEPVVKKYTLTILGLKLDHKGTEEDPFTVKDTLAVADTLNTGTTYQVDGVNHEVYIVGYVTDVGTDKGNYRNNVYIADVAGTSKDKSLWIYSINYSDPKFDIAVGDKILISGFIVDFKGDKEIGSAKVDGSTKYAYFVELLEEAAPVEPGESASLAFNATTSTKFEESQAVFTANGITVTQDKASSVTPCNNGDYITSNDQIRVYSKSELTIAYSGIDKIVFHCNDLSASYVTALESSLKSAYSSATVTVDELDVTIEFAKTVSIASFVASAQIRIDSIDINPAD